MRTPIRPKHIECPIILLEAVANAGDIETGLFEWQKLCAERMNDPK